MSSPTVGAFNGQNQFMISITFLYKRNKMTNAESKDIVTISGYY